MTVEYYILDGINPVPWTAPEASVGYRKGGHYVQMHKTESLRAYQESVKDLFPSQNRNIVKLEGKFQLEFYFWRRLDSYEIEDGKRSSDHWADATNMQKALEDALQGILYDNDRDCMDIRSRIMAQGPDVDPRILIVAYPHEDNWTEVEELAVNMAAMLPKVEPVSNVRKDFNPSDVF